MTKTRWVSVLSTTIVKTLVIFSVTFDFRFIIENWAHKQTNGRSGLSCGCESKQISGYHAVLSHITHTSSCPPALILSVSHPFTPISLDRCILKECYLVWIWTISLSDWDINPDTNITVNGFILFVRPLMAQNCNILSFSKHIIIICSSRSIT